MRAYLLLIGLLAGLCLPLAVPASPALAVKHSTVAIARFKFNGPPSMAYLKDGLRDMLAGRLTAEAGVKVLPGGGVDKQLAEAGPELPLDQAAKVTQSLGADFLIYGSITSMGQGLSVDAKVFNPRATGADQVQSFYGSASGGADMMRAIDKVSWDILEVVFGKKRPASSLATTSAAPTPSPFMTVHPDKMFMTTGGGFGGTRAFTRTRTLKMSLRAVSVGDVDGDGEMELVLADDLTVTVYKRQGSRINAIATSKMPARFRIHGVNAADIDGNGRAEIYISASDTKMPGSRIAEWDGKGLAVLMDGLRWYIRPVHVPGQGLVLGGQRAGLDTPIGEGVYRMMRNGSTLSPEERLKLPPGINLFNFEYIDLDGDGGYEVVAIDNGFHLRVYGPSGDLKYKSSDRFCGNRRIIGGRPNITKVNNPRADDEVDGRDERYPEIPVPSRILIADADGDGLPEVVLNRNPKSLVGAAMPRSAQYNHGTMVGLAWNGIGMEEMWRTRRIDGYVVDYQEKSRYAELPDDVKDELFIAVVLRSGLVDSLFSDQSAVLIYPFEYPLVETAPAGR